LTSDIGARVRDGVGRLTEDELLKLVPGQVTIEMAEAGADFDYVLNWYEARYVKVRLAGGKVVSATAVFSDEVTSKTLTLANFKKIAKGMTLADVKKILEGPGFVGSRSEGSTLDAAGEEVGVCEWMEGTRVFARIKDGQIVAGGSETGAKNK
jgi:hypothetical protein